ncbi:hypothetical protein B0T10DRAFT_605776 [Thelonectria olida]|uniref:Uncharacterized protein n=1 Tax=Thelonectria olida TaxID=1576542 RepID=A0A9P8W7X5_9HYPO|nr:hypothetical protein B0T10DRAFT_605776 [Thelonectria olida]
MNASQKPHSSRYAWLTQPDGVVCRFIDEAERFYASFCRSPHDPTIASFPVTGYASFTVLDATGSDVERALRSAWTALRQENPSLSSWIQFNSQRAAWQKMNICFDPSKDNSTEENWLSQTFKTVVSEAGDDWLSHDPPVGKLPTLFLVQPSTQDNRNSWNGAVYLRSPHDVVDGVGVLHLLNRLFEHARESHSGIATTPNPANDEINRLSLPLDAITGILEHATEQQKSRFQDLLAQNATIQTEKPLIGLPVRDITCSQPRNIQRATISLSEDMSRHLLKQCKRHNVTITHVMSAAVVMALRDLQPLDLETSSVRYSNQALISLRHLCKPPFGSFAMGNYHMIAPEAMAIDVTSSHSKPPQQTPASELLSTAHQFRHYYTSVRTGLNESPHDYLAFARMTWDLFTPKESSVPPPPLKTAAVAISSLGDLSTILKGNYGSFELTDAWVAGEPLGTGADVHVALEFLQDPNSVKAVLTTTWAD